MKAKIEFDLESPVKCTDAEFQEWVMYHLGFSKISEPNPLRGYDMHTGSIDNVIIDGVEID